MRERVQIGRGPGRALRLEAGSHDSPRDGVCIVELASVIAGEPFSDHPRCVCKVIAAFLRSWNVRASHSARQRLLPYAQRVVGSRAARRVTRRRRDVCLTWAGADLTGNVLSRAIWRLAMRVRIFVLSGIGPAVRLNEGAGHLAARAVFARNGAETALQLVDTLLAIGSEADSAHASANGSGNGARNGWAHARDSELERALVERAIRANGNGLHHDEAPPSVAAPDESREPTGVA
jgi:hypothetical protein